MVEVALTRDDLGAAVAAGQLTEAQAAGLTALAQARAGRRAAMGAGDEPFELYRGFNDVFVMVGVIILLAGLGFFTPGGVVEFLAPAAPGNGGAVVGWAAVMGLVIWGLAEYFTGRRRMVAPSIVLVLHLSYYSGVAAGTLAAALTGAESVARLALAFLGASAAAGAFHLRFGLPFALFPAAGALLAAALTMVGLVDAAALAAFRQHGLAALVDLGAGTAFPLVTLVFGLAVFALAMRHDMADPHRVTRHAACGFWLHLLAAPAIVNTAAFTLYAGGGPLATLGLVAFLLALTAVALAVDRRSFLLSGAGYVAALLIAGLGTDSFAAVLVFLGMLILGLGAGWTGLRARLMRALPAFPGKDRLPPWRLPEAAP